MQTKAVSKLLVTEFGVPDMTISSLCISTTQFLLKFWCCHWWNSSNNLHDTQFE